MNLQAVEAGERAKSKSPQSIGITLVAHTKVEKENVLNGKLMKGTYRLTATY